MTTVITHTRDCRLSASNSAEHRAVVHIGPMNLELPATRGGAIERRMVELAAAQAKRGARVIVYSRGQRDGQVEYAGFEICHRHGRSGRPGRLALSLACAREIASLKPRVVHLHSRADVGWLMRRLAPDVPTVLSCDYHLEPLHSIPVVRTVSRCVWTLCMHSVSVVAPVSRYCAGQHCSRWSLDSARVAVLPNGVDLERFRPDPQARHEWRRRLGLADRLVLLYVGRLCEQKGTDLLVKAWRELRRDYPAAHLVAVGPADKFGQVRSNAVTQALLAEGGTYVPPVSDLELPGVYNMADVFIMPTRELEMFGMAAVEAQACGKPVVASNNGGLCETVTARSGLHFRAGDAEALASVLRTLLSSPETLMQLATGARDEVRRFAWENIAAYAEEIYRQATTYVERIA